MLVMTTEEKSIIDDCPDIFGREEIAERMSDLICSTPAQDVSPLVLDGPWGCGKTTHALRIEKIINSKKSDTHKCIYWNAARSDYASDPLAMFVSSMYKYVSWQNKRLFTKSALKLCGAAISGASINAGLQLMSPCGVDVSKIVKAGMKPISSDSFRQLIKEASDVESRMRNAQTIIESLAKDKEVVFIVDELDRCRPDFSLKMLENIKHSFDKARCKFVLVMNKESMISSVRQLYGLEREDAERYISKFVKIHLHLPGKAKGKCSDCNFDYFNHLMADYGLEQFLNDNVIKDLLERVSRLRKINLREIEKIANAVKLMFNACFQDEKESRGRADCLVIVSIAYLFVCDSKELENLYAKSATSSKFLNSLGYVNVSSNDSAIYARNWLDYIMKVYLSINPVEEAMNIAENTQGVHWHDLYASSAVLGRLISFCMMLA